MFDYLLYFSSTQSPATVYSAGLDHCTRVAVKLWQMHWIYDQIQTGVSGLFVLLGAWCAMWPGEIKTHLPE